MPDSPTPIPTPAQPAFRRLVVFVPLPESATRA
jgi:hypothetical protein